MKLILSCVAIFCAIFVSANAYGQTESVGFRNWFLIADPSNERQGKEVRSDVSRGWLCVDGRTGRLLGTCPVDFELFDSQLPISIDNVQTNCVLDANDRATPGTCADGGHRHQDAAGAILPGVASDRPDLYFTINDKGQQPDSAVEDVRFPGDMDNEPRTVTGGFAGSGIISPDKAFTWTVPHVGGIYAFKSTMRPSVLNTDSKFVEFAGGILFLRDRLEARGELNVTFRRDTLRQLPAQPLFYLKGRGGNASHDDSLSYAAQEKTIQAAALIGYLFQQIDGRKLSYNDISLPKGGIFDWDVSDPNFAWRRSHLTHREGLDVDINRPRDSNNMPERCDVEFDVRTAVNYVLTELPRPDGTPTALLCENKPNGFPNNPGNFHLDVTNFKITPSMAAALKALQQNPPP